MNASNLKNKQLNSNNGKNKFKFKNNLVLNSLSLIFLVLILINISYSAVVFSNVQYYGHLTNYLNYAVQNDSLVVKMNLSYNNDVLPNDFNINISYFVQSSEYSEKITNCNPIYNLESTSKKNYTYCEQTLSRKIGLKSSGVRQYVIKVINDTVVHGTYSFSLNIDNSIPRITGVDFSEDGLFTSLNIKFDDSVSTVECSKVSKIEISNENSGYTKTIELNSELNSQSCLGIYKFSVQNSELGVSGNNTLVFRAVDNLGNTGADFKKKIVLSNVINLNFGTEGYSLIDKNTLNEIKYCIPDYGPAKLIFSFNANENDKPKLIYLIAKSLGLTDGLTGAVPISVSSNCKLVRLNQGLNQYVCQKDINFNCISNRNNNAEIISKKINLTIRYDSARIPDQKVQLSKDFSVDLLSPQIDMNSIANVIYYDSISKDVLYSIDRKNILFFGKDSSLKFSVSDENGIDLVKSKLKVGSLIYSISSCDLNNTLFTCYIKGFQNIESQTANNCIIGKDLQNCKGSIEVYDKSSNLKKINFTYVIDDKIPVIEGEEILASKYSENSLDLDIQNNRYVVSTDKFSFTLFIDSLPAKLIILKGNNSNTRIIDKDDVIDCKAVKKSNLKRIINVVDSRQKNEEIVNVCTAEIPIVTGSVPEGKLNYAIIDYANNIYQKELEVTILDHDFDSSNIFEFKEPKLLQKTVSRQSASATKIIQNLMFSVDYGLINSNVKAKIGKIALEKSSCKITNGPNILGTPNIEYTTSSSIFFSMQLKSTSIDQLERYNSLEMTCNISIYAVKDEKSLAKENEEIVFIIPLSNDPLNPVGANIQKKINKTLNDRLYKLAKKIEKVEKLIKTGKQVCDGMKIVQILTSSFNLNLLGLDKIAKSLPPGGAKEAAEANNQVLNNGPGQKTQDMFSQVTKSVTKFCELLNCKKDKNRQTMLGKIDGLNKLFGDDFQLGGMYYGSMINPRQSLIGNMITLCLPGILEHLDKDRYIQCTYIDCLRNKVPRGYPVAVCESEHKYLMCEYQTGQILGMLPFVHIFREFGGYIQSMAQNPLAMVFGSKWNDCLRTGRVDTDSMCRMLNSMKTWNEIAQVIQSYQTTFKKSEVDKICSSAERGLK